MSIYYRFVLRNVITILIVAIVMSNSGCFVNFETRQADPDLSLGLKIEREEAFAMSREIVEDIRLRQEGALYFKMSEVFRQTYPLEEMSATFEKMSGHFGHLRSADYKTEEIGYWNLPDGTKLPMRKFFYSASTDKAEKGKYFVQVSIVEENDKLRCASFSMLDFPNGIPQSLR